MDQQGKPLVLHKPLNGRHKTNRNMFPKGKHPRYHKDFVAVFKELALLGMTEQEMADTLGINRTTIHRWKKKHEELSNTINGAKAIADARTAADLHSRTTWGIKRRQQVVMVKGIPEIVTLEEELPPDIRAASIWLANRQRAKWSVAPKPALDDSNEIEREKIPLENLARALVFLIQKANHQKQEFVDVTPTKT